MKVEEISSIDFSKYKRVLLDKVIITGAKINAEKDRWDGVGLTGCINGEYAICSFYYKEDEVIIQELDSETLVIRREGRKG